MTLSANYEENTRSLASPYFLIPMDKGEYHVYVECEGLMACKSIGGKADGCWIGLLAYDATHEGWRARSYTGTVISNYQANNTTVCAHPDVKLNDCTFKANRGVESDFTCSFHLKADAGSYWALQAPDIMKGSEYNYCVSYGNYTEKNLEWGTISITIDEVNSQSYSMGRFSSWRAKPIPYRPAVITGETGDYPEGKPGSEVNPSYASSQAFDSDVEGTILPRSDSYSGSELSEAPFSDMRRIVPDPASTLLEEVNNLPTPSEIVVPDAPNHTFRDFTAPIGKGKAQSEESDLSQITARLNKLRNDAAVRQGDLSTLRLRFDLKDAATALYPLSENAESILRSEVDFLGRVYKWNREQMKDAWDLVTDGLNDGKIRAKTLREGRTRRRLFG